eukprot:g64406.t1
MTPAVHTQSFPTFTVAVRVGPAGESGNSEAPGSSQRARSPLDVHMSRKLFEYREKMSLVLAVNVVPRSRSSVSAMNWVLNNPLNFEHWSVTVISAAKKKDTGVVKTMFEAYSKTFSELHPSTSIECKCLPVDKFGIGHTVKAFCRQVKPTLLVVGASKDKNDKDKTALRDYWRTCDSFCPVLVVKTEWLAPVVGHSWHHQRVMLAQAPTLHCDHAFSFLGKFIRLREPQNELVIVHAVMNKNDKPRAREYLAGHAEKCQGKPFIIRSALLYAKKFKTVQASLLAYAELKGKECDLVVCSPVPNSQDNAQPTRPSAKHRSKTRVGGQLTDFLLTNLSTDIIFFKDDRTQAMIQGPTQGFMKPLTRILQDAISHINLPLALGTLRLMRIECPSHSALWGDSQWQLLSILLSRVSR